ncbi:adenosylcobinamide-GDP ribazoletransferase [Thermosynechococcaceae cyanobacterium Okahandja]
MKSLWQEWLGAVMFYTCLPLPATWPMKLTGAAKWCPAVGVLIGGMLLGAQALLTMLHLPRLLQSVLVVALWLLLTGGLHLDGAMDTADGLAVTDPQRRLTVMADSRSGAFGVMAASLILLLKVSALAGGSLLPFSLLWATLWGRIAQVWAIARYPYLKATGTGQIHKASCRFPRDFGPSAVLLTLLSAVLPLSLGQLLYLHSMGLLLLLLVPAWFQRRLGGQTGDTYGAVVEWTEALMLVSLSVGQGG